MSLVQHAGAYATSDSALGALQRNGFGTSNSLPAPARGKGFYRAPTLGENCRGNHRCPPLIWALRINMFNNCREKCANLTSLGRRTSVIIAVGVERS